MATEEEVLAYINSLEKTSYIALIDTTTADYPSKKIQYTILGNFITNRINRLAAIQDLIAVKETEDDTSGNFVQFQAALSKISGKVDDLDYKNGLLAQTVNKDIRTRRFMKREIIELTKKRAIVTEVGNRYDTYKTDMDDLKNILNNLA